MILISNIILFSSFWGVIIFSSSNFFNTSGLIAESVKIVESVLISTSFFSSFSILRGVFSDHKTSGEEIFSNILFWGDGVFSVFSLSHKAGVSASRFEKSISSLEGSKLFWVIIKLLSIK